MAIHISESQMSTTLRVIGAAKGHSFVVCLIWLNFRHLNQIEKDVAQVNRPETKI